ncbi:MAG: phospholipase [Candidatus Eisenbacteria bacterium]|nr:phospholipase [Candidatus Eisenbacteria bacterium]
MLTPLLDLSPHLRRRLIAALETGVLAPGCSLLTLRAALGAASVAEPELAALQELERMGITGRAAAAWIESVEALAARLPRPDLVWSGPEVPGVHARDTREVFAELIGSAERDIWISTFAFFDGPTAFEALARRMDARPELSATLLLNLQRRRGDTSSADTLIQAFARRFWAAEWPGRRRPRVYYDPRALEIDGPEGVLHAKALVVDEEALFVTSANLTEAAFDRNIELGVVVRDRAMALAALRQFRGLVERGVLGELSR